VEVNTAQRADDVPDRASILVVDDLPEKLLVLQTILAELDQNIVVARSGEEALKRVLEEEFAVVLLDINMPPGMDGLETAEYIRRRKRSAHTPIIFITAYADEVHTARGYSLGAVDYIFAPIVPEILRTKVRVFVDLHLMHRQVRRQADERVALAREQSARVAAEEATRRSAFLAEASTVLSRSLDVQATLRGLVGVVVPYLADLAGATVVGESGRPWQSELAWADPGGDGVQALQLTSADAPNDALRDAIDRALASGEPERLDDLAIPYPQAPGHANGRADARRLTAALVLPLLARGRTLGALTLAMGGSGRRYSAADVALAQDLAGRAAIALDNARLYQNIQEQDRRKNEFLAMLAHELRNPLAPIRNAVHILKMLGATDATLMRARDMIDRQVGHMARLIDDLLDMSRLSRGKVLLRRQPVDLARLVEDAAGDYRPVLEAAGLALRLELPDVPVCVDGDPTRLAQVLGNVLHNAHKFTDAGGAVTVRLAAENGEACITVRDSGIGMEPEMLGRIFETFSQADSSLDRSRGGLGLGLALVKGLIQLHGGSVRAQSDGLGRGTSIAIRLPLHDAAALAPPEPAPARADAPGGCRVLIIEDHADAAESLRMLFSFSGHDVHVVHTGPDGVSAARRLAPDVVLCDIGLPGMDGYAVARALRQDRLASRLIALSGYGREDDLRRSREAGFDLHLTKPVDFPELQRVLADLRERAAAAGAGHGGPVSAEPRGAS
jgi:signal transduction histidine kinase/DNA-binding response OmpR family regulator